MIRMFIVIVSEIFKESKAEPIDNNSHLRSLKWIRTKIFAAEHKKGQDRLKQLLRFGEELFEFFVLGSH